MSHKRDKKIREAVCAADYLEGLGKRYDARVIRDLCRSLAATSETASRLHFDNMLLRKELAKCSD